MSGQMVGGSYENFCKPPRRLSISERLEEREAGLTQQLQEVRRAREILAKNPEFLELLDSMQSIGGY